MVEAVDLSSSATAPAAEPSPIHLHAARNETVSFCVRCNASVSHGWTARFDRATKLPAEWAPTIAAYQVLPVTCDLNTAEFVRRTGELAQTASLPRVLLPLPLKDGSVDLAALHQSANWPLLLWFDVHVPVTAATGNCAAELKLLDGAHRTAGKLPVQLDVNPLVLPPSPGLKIVGTMQWEQLQRLFPGAVDALTPRLLSRSDLRDTAAIKLLDQLVALGRENRVCAVVPALAPIVKWPAMGSPDVDWSDFDALVGPWLNGSAFADRRPMAYWPLPQPRALANFDPASQADYWKLAAKHFDERAWLARAPLVLAAEAEPAALADLTTRALAANSNLHIQVPLGGVAMWSALSDDRAKQSAGRLITAAPGLVQLPLEFQGAASSRWIGHRPGELLPSFGADLAQTREMAWLAFLRRASVWMWDDPLPAAPADEPTSVDESPWFYPGQALGVDHPLETVQLKWARQAEQDWEYLALLGRQGGEQQLSMQTAQLLVKPLLVDNSARTADPQLALLCGTDDERAWDIGRQLLVRAIGRLDTDPLWRTDPDAARWAAAIERPIVLLRNVEWTWDTQPPSKATIASTGHHVIAKLQLDVRDPAIDLAPASKDGPPAGSVQWAEVANGWQVQPQPLSVPFRTEMPISAATLQASVDLSRSTGAGPGVPLEPVLTAVFTSGASAQTATLRWALPVAESARRRRPLEIDGSLDDWYPDDALQLDRPLVRMLSRPALRSDQLALATTESSIYSSWSDENFYLAFRLGGVSSEDLRATHNFVDYQMGRAWGEDLAEVLLQPVYVDGSTGPLLHVVAKPTGQWVERWDERAKDWKAIEGVGIRYAGGVDSAKHIWRGELAIPWQAIDAKRSRPALLRFNFAQHKQADGESASWAGPVDSGRDSAVMGLVHLAEGE